METVSDKDFAVAVLVVLGSVVGQLSKANLIDVGALTEEIQRIAADQRHIGATGVALGIHTVSEYLLKTTPS